MASIDLLTLNCASQNLMDNRLLNELFEMLLLSTEKFIFYMPCSMPDFADRHSVCNIYLDHCLCS